MSLKRKSSPYREIKLQKWMNAKLMVQNNRFKSIRKHNGEQNKYLKVDKN